MNSVYDVGGMDGFGPIQREENEPVFHEPWEARLRAMFILSIKRCGYFNLHESRYVVDRMDPVFYLGSSYYKRWLLRLETMLKEKGVLTDDQIQERMAQFSPLSNYKPDLEAYRKVIPPVPSTQRRISIPATTGTEKEYESIKPNFSPGTLVKAKTMAPLGHTRIPRYIRGKQGVVEDIHGTFALPDLIVQEGIMVYQPVYRVRFKAQEIWGEDASPKDTLCIELWEDYLESGGTENEKYRNPST